MKKIIVITAAFVLAAVFSGLDARADEGMWLINAVNKALEKKMQERGLELSANEIYNAAADGSALSDAVVSLDFGCTGSIVSDKGLVITNHHCAYADVHSLSTDENNYLEKGFWAMTDKEEIPIPGKHIFFLDKVVDVTDEVKAVVEEARAEGKPMGSRKLMSIMEKRYREKTGKEAWLASMWSASKYYIAIYDVYSDVRLVAAPPVSMAAFGGDVDNWEWPQHKCDFAMYRIYTAPDGSPAEYSETNVPLKPLRKLEISLDGYRPGDYTMVIGFPGRTNRYSSSFEVDRKETLTLPISNRLRGKQMEIINKWMASDPSIRLLYSDYYFGLSNVQELNEGEVKCFGRFGVVKAKEQEEKELQEWIDADPERKAKWGTLLEDLKTKYAATDEIEKIITYYRETLVRGTLISRTTSRIGSLRGDVLKKNKIKRMSSVRSKPDSAEIRCCREYRFRGNDFACMNTFLMKEYEKFDFKVERDLFRYSLEEFYENMDYGHISDYQKELLAEYTGADGKCDYDAMTAYLWDNSIFTSIEKITDFLNEDHTLNDYFADPLYRFYQEIGIFKFNQERSRLEGKPNIMSLEQQLTHAQYQMMKEKGIEQYPDANSTMRITYGTVGDISPYDAVTCSWRSTPAGILEKYNPSVYEFSLTDTQKSLYEQADWGRWGFYPSGSKKGKKGEEKTMYVNFLTDNDITGGNSGSPVMNSKGQLIGLAFDGNKESLASDAAYIDGYNKCVCVDIRFVLWTLDKYAGMDRIIAELGF